MVIAVIWLLYVGMYLCCMLMSLFMRIAVPAFGVVDEEVSTLW